MKFHDLKCWPGPFNATMLGEKRFEYRKNDRDFKVGDVLVLREFCPEVPGLEMMNVGYTGRVEVVKVTYILGAAPCDKVYGIPEGYVIMSVTPVSAEVLALRTEV